MSNTINKVVYDGNVLIDLTDLDVTAGDVVSGVTFIMKDGTKAVGTLSMADYVIEEGTSGNWRYTKWNSGKYECWYHANYGDITLSTTLGTDIVSNVFTIAFPITFTAVPFCSVNYEGNSTGYCWVQQSNANATTTSRSYGIRLARIGTSSITLNNNYVSCYACGKWK